MSLEPSDPVTALTLWIAPSSNLMRMRQPSMMLQLNWPPSGSL